MKKLKICADPFPPYQYIDENGQPKGLDYSIIYNILKAAGYDADINIIPWSEAISAFENKEYHGIFQVQDTPERIAKYKLSNKLRDAVTQVVKLKDNNINVSSYEELADYRLGLIEGFANGDEIDNLNDSCKFYYPGTKELIDALLNREIDLAVCDKGVREYITDNDTRIRAIDNLTYKRPLYVMFHSEELRDQFNKELQQQTL